MGLNKNKLIIAMGFVTTVAATPAAAILAPPVQEFNWNGTFRFFDGNGAAIANTSISPKGNNWFETPISGTLTWDQGSFSGAATVTGFEWGNGASPFEVTSFDLQGIGDGAGGPGTLILGNMLFNWNGNTGQPVSIVMDAQGFFAGDLDGTGGLGAVPASDGTYIGSSVPGTATGPGGYPGYFGLGPIPIATTAWNTTDNCIDNVNCIGAIPSGGLPLVFDTATNINDDIPNDGGGIAGSPMIDGVFQGSSIAIEITEMSEVPIPAAVWLFGSGLLGLIGIARRRHLAR